MMIHEYDEGLLEEDNSYGLLIMREPGGVDISNGLPRARETRTIARKNRPCLLSESEGVPDDTRDRTKNTVGEYDAYIRAKQLYEEHHVIRKSRQWEKLISLFLLRVF